MLRFLTPLALCAALLAAGCIAPPDRADAASFDLPPPEEGGTMTLDHEADDATRTSCLGGAVPLPAGETCVTRTVSFSGVLTLTSLPVTIDVGSADVTVEPGEDDAWLVQVVILGRGATEEEAARQANDVEVSTIIGAPGAHALTVGVHHPERQTSTAIVDVLVRLPKDALYGLVVDSGSGDVGVDGLRTAGTVLDTGSGDVTLGGGFSAASLVVDAGSGDVSAEGVIRNVVVDTGSGDVTLRLAPDGSGAVTVGTGSGSVQIQVPEEARRGYRVTLDTGSGDATIGLKDGQVQRNDGEDVGFVTSGFDARPIRTVITASTGSGDASVSPA